MKTANMLNDGISFSIGVNGETDFNDPYALDIKRCKDFQGRAPTPMGTPVIEGLFRYGEVVNVIAGPKVGKSWLVLGMASDIALGRDWMGRSTDRCKVLIVDNELHPQTLEDRIRKVACAKHIEYQDLEVEFACLRGKSVDINELQRMFNKIERDEFGVIILDAFYRFLPEGVSENDNAQMMRVYNTLDALAAETGAAIVVIHHSSKGNQTQKNVTDVGSGAGSIARAADTHLVIRRHDLENLAVIEARCRTFAPPEPHTMEFEFPLWRFSSEPPVLEQKKSKSNASSEANWLAGLKQVHEEFGISEFTDHQIRSTVGGGADKASNIRSFGVRKGYLEKSGEREPERGRKTNADGSPKVTALYRFTSIKLGTAK